MRQSRVLAMTALGLAAATVLAACSATTSGAGSPASTAAGTAGSDSVPAPSTAPATPSSSTAVPTTPTPSSATHSSKPPTHPAPSTPLRSVTVNAADGSSYLVMVWADTQVPNCAAHAYGAPVIAYLKKHACHTLTRTLATTTIGGRGVGISASSVSFTGTDPQVYQTAGNFAQLVTKNGTGSLNDLLREGYRLPAGPTSVPDPDAFFAAGQDAGVTVFDSWYLTGTTPANDKALVSMEKSVFLAY